MNSSRSNDPSVTEAFPSTWITIPIFNRRETSVGCLRHLHQTGVLDWCHVVVCDGGSTDGSVEVIRAEFPEITILQGKWWWMEGIRAGMEYSQQQGAEIFVWLNDDCYPRPGSFEALLKNVTRTGHVSGGVTHTVDGAYSAMTKTPWGLRPLQMATDLGPSDVISVDSLVGNFVGIPAACVERIGLPDAKLFPHLCGDSYYTMEAVSKGFRCDLVGAAQADDSHGGNLMANLSIIRGNTPLKTLLSKQFKMDPRMGFLPSFRLARRFWGTRGWLVALVPWCKDLMSICVRALLPSAIRTRL